VESLLADIDGLEAMRRGCHRGWSAVESDTKAQLEDEITTLQE